MITPTIELGSILKNRVRVGNFKKLGVETVYDLLTYYPRKVIPAATKVTGIAGVRAKMKKATKLNELRLIFCATILKCSVIPARGKWGVSRLQLFMKDERGETFFVLFFAKNMRYLKWVESKYKPGDEAVVLGSPKLNKEQVQFIAPDVFVVKPADYDSSRKAFPSAAFVFEKYERPITVYPATKRLGSSRIAETISQTINALEDRGEVSIKDPWADQESTPETELLPDVLPWQSRFGAIKQIHQPHSLQEYHNAVQQLKFEEAYILQVLLAQRRQDIRSSRARARVRDERGVFARFEEIMPFKLTRSQMKVGKTIQDELAKPVPMQRLLQGDVGSGKTIVALRAMLQVVDAGGQAVLLAPTEVLANQHFLSISNILGDLKVKGVRHGDFPQVRVELLNGALKTAEKRRVEESIRTGEADIIVGTHALLYRRELFKDLGIVVVDEQHKFGVEQRDLLRQQKDYIPHLLVMTATPIPRSVAMLSFADLEISVLKEMPGGRGEIQTFVIDSKSDVLVKRMWERVREEIDSGRNVFVVVPRIHKSSEEGLEGKTLNNEEDEVDEEEYELVAQLFQKLTSQGLSEPLEETSESVESVAAMVKSNVALKGVDFGILHGEMSSEEKELAMRDFVDFKTPLLISTTVVEVGIDVPNATTMVIMDADKFGMSTLHQLRGRIGRGEHQSICFLVTSSGAVTDLGAERIKTIEKTLDGFKIAQQDLKLRGEGDIIGSKQSGTKSSLKLLQILGDQEVIVEAHDEAVKTLKSDPTLEKHPGLKAAVEKELSEMAKEYIEKS
ncbi:MAG: ATP-dependent DNA helicase RecG [Candidatus Ancillula sp.]|jgi:ATP-dependent DNA helicase RecG|nr:ATP-dependent DNA helicase RecG [Candidatus Ancillula sp.]